MTKSRGVADWGHYPPVNNNILINPSFTVFQRAGTTLSGAWGLDHLGISTTYGPDRWRLRGLDRVGGQLAESSVSVDPTTGTNKLVVKHDGATNNSYTYQFIEAVNLLGLYGKEMTFSFSYSDVGGSGIPIARISSWDSSDTQKTLFEAVPTSLGNNRWSCTATLTTADGTIPDPNQAGMQVLIFADQMNAAPDEWSAWETKLEAGSVDTPCVARQFTEELALCQRYYFEWNTNESDFKRIALGQYTTIDTVQGSLSLPVVMRSRPSADYNCDVWGENAFTISSFIVYDGIGTFSATTSTANRNLLASLRFNAAGEYLKIDAEL